MKCGKCKESHATVAEVRACFDLKSEPLTTVHDGHNGQYEFIQELMAERGITPLGPYDEVKGQLSKREASELIAHLIDNVPALQVAPGNNQAALQKFDVPQGFYAVKSKTGNNDLDFFKVDRPTEGKWKGYTFVHRVIGGRPDSRVRGTTAIQALQDITDAGPMDAGRLFGQTIGQCCDCNRHLTKKASRELGRGPDCAELAGLGAEWQRLNMRYHGE